MGKGAMTRERILDEAMRIASRDGLEGLSIGGLATALSLSKSGLFAHFGSKEALQVVVLEHTGARFRERMGPRGSCHYGRRESAGPPSGDPGLGGRSRPPRWLPHHGRLLRTR